MANGNITYDPIAVVGVGCRFPGGIHDAASMWKLLINGGDALSEIPENRFGDLSVLTDSGRGAGKIVINQGGFLENVDQFDAAFFNISNREAELMDPQQRIMLEIAFEAIEDAGWKVNQLSNSKTGVYIGQWTSDYESRVRRAVGDLDLYATLGTGRYATAGRISFAFNLRGPSMVIDTHCSSSLVSVHHACQALRTGEVDVALAGGVNTILDPFISIAYSRSGILSDYGQCRFGDDGGSGYVRSEGAGIVVLKQLSKAVEDGDQVYGVIRSSVVNNDGRTNKYMAAPSSSSQAEMLTEAYSRAGIDPAEVNYIEAHGTGTKVGDPAEINALNAILGKGRGSKCVIGSVKTNIGHTEAAAGIAGFLKTLLIVSNRIIPASLHIKTPNSSIDWDTIPFEISQEQVSLENKQSAICAGVNSFGITGTNAHVVLEEFKTSSSDEGSSGKQFSDIPLIFPYSANSDRALEEYAVQYKAALAALPEEERHNWIAHLCNQKSDLRQRKAITASSMDDLLSKLGVPDEELEGIVEGSADIHAVHKTVFVFPGQGSQWPGMGKELYESESVFRDEINAWETAFSKITDWKLTAELFEKSGDEALSSIDIIQPALVAMEAALAKLWFSWNIRPDAVLGHSMGEVAAAYIAGLLSIDDAAAVICHRSRLMKTTSGKGAMGYIALTPEAALERLKGKEELLGIAVNNSPDSVVVSGESSALDALLDELEDEEIFCRKIKVDVASHSPQMDAVTGELEQSVSHIQPVSGTLPFYSTVFQDLADGNDLNASYWVKNLRQPVQFAKTVQKILRDGATFFLEMSPHPVLLQAIKENASHAGKPISTGGSLFRDQDGILSFYQGVGNAWCNGLSPDWSRLYGDAHGKIQLPSYPWDRETFWIDESGIDPNAAGPAIRESARDEDNAASSTSFREELLGMDPGKAKEAVENRIKELTGSVVKKKVAALKSGMAFKTLGIDSLMAVQLKEKLEKVFEIPVSVTSFWTYATISEYTDFLASTIGLIADQPEEKPGTGSDDISDDDISDLLAGELEDLL